MDALLKFCLQGWKSYWCSILNKFDFIVTLLIVALHFFSFLYPNTRPWYIYFDLQLLHNASFFVLLRCSWTGEGSPYTLYEYLLKQNNYVVISVPCEILHHEIRIKFTVRYEILLSTVSEFSRLHFPTGYHICS